MGLFTYFAVYVIVWFLCLFAVLPFRVHNQVDTGQVVPGTEPGAPALLHLWPKFAVTTLAALVVSVVVFWLLANPTLQEYWR